MPALAKAHAAEQSTQTESAEIQGNLVNVSDYATELGGNHQALIDEGFAAKETPASRNIQTEPEALDADHKDQLEPHGPEHYQAFPGGFRFSSLPGRLDKSHLEDTQSQAPWTSSPVSMTTLPGTVEDVLAIDSEAPVARIIKFPGGEVLGRADRLISKAA